MTRAPHHPQETHGGFLRADYHFHPNLPWSRARAARKVAAIYRRFLALDIRAVIVTEHAFKDYQRAYSFMAAQKPAGMHVFPGVEYVTREDIDIILFFKDPTLYSLVPAPFAYTYEEVVEFVLATPGIFAFVTHPLTLGATSVVNKKGMAFTRQMIEKLGAVEASYTVYSGLKQYFVMQLLFRVFPKTWQRILRGENLPQELRPQRPKFLAVGSDAHFVAEIGTHALVPLRSDGVFASLVQNSDLHIGGSRTPSFLWNCCSLCMTFLEWLMKRIYRARTLWKNPSSLSTHR